MAYAFVGVYRFGVDVCLVDVDAGAVISEGLVDKGCEVVEAYATKGGTCVADVLFLIRTQVFAPR